MPRFSKRLKKYERSFLIGLTVLLLASFMVLPTMRCTGVSGAEDYGGTFQTAPGKTVSISSDDFLAVEKRYWPLYQILRTPSLRYAGELIGAPQMRQEAATWCHIVLVEAAKDAGYRVGDEELKDGVQLVVTAMANRAVPGGRGLGFSQDLYERVVRDLYQHTTQEFETTVREILLKDKYLTPLVDSMRAAKGREEAFQDWKKGHERLDLEFAALPAAQFVPAVELEEKTREAIGVQEGVLEKLLHVTSRVKGIFESVEKRKAQLGRWPKDEAELTAKLTDPAPGQPAQILDKMTEDDWGTPLSYRLVDDKPVVRSAGPDKTLDTADDVDLGTRRVVDALSSLRIAADAVVTWKTASGKWPDKLADLTGAPPSRWSEPSSPGGAADPKAAEAKDLLKRVTAALDEWRKAAGSLPERLDALTGVPPHGEGPAPAPPLKEVPKDPWGHDLAYERGFSSLASLGADGVRGTLDDWRTTFAATVPPLHAIPKDPWDHELVWDPAGPALSCLGPDGQPGTADDLKAEISESGARVPAGAAFAPWVAKDGEDAWHRPLLVQFRAASPPRFEVSSPGADGALGTDDDLKDGNAAAVAAFYARIKHEYRLPDRREFEALWVHLPRVPDESLKAAWAKLPEHHPADLEKEAWDKFRGQYGSEAGAYYRTEEETKDADGKTVTSPIDPADREKGHGVALAPKDKPAWLVPAPECFGDMKDPPAQDGPAGSADDPLWKTYVEKGWRRVLLREMFFERLLDDLLDKCSESQAKHKEWEDKGKQGAPVSEPVVATFSTRLAELAEFQPSAKDREEGAMFLQYFATAKDKPLTREEWEALPEFGEPTTSAFLQMLAKDGEYANNPTVVKGSSGRVLLRNVKLHPSREPELAEPGIREKVWPRYLESRAMDRAVRELERVRDAAEKAPGAAFQATLEAAGKERGWTHGLGRTGPFVGYSRPLPVPEGASDEEKEAVRRRNFVRAHGYEEVKPQGSRQDTTRSEVGGFGRRVLRDEADTLAEKDATKAAYLLRVAAREDATSDEFGGARYLEWLESKAYAERQRGSSVAVMDQSGFVTQAVAQYFDDYERLSVAFGLKTKRSLMQQVYPPKKGGD